MMSDIEITAELVRLRRSPTALLAVLGRLALGLVGFDFGGPDHPADVTARLNGRLVGRRRVWKAASLDPLIASMKKDAAELSIEHFERRWLHAQPGEVDYGGPAADG